MTDFLRKLGDRLFDTIVVFAFLAVLICTPIAPILTGAINTNPTGSWAYMLIMGSAYICLLLIMSGGIRNRHA